LVTAYHEHQTSALAGPAFLADMKLQDSTTTC